MQRYLIILALLAASCANRNKYPDKMIFRYNESAGISSLDPAYSRNLENIWACNMLYNGLIEVDDNLKIKPALAKDWSIDSTGTIYRFNLRNDVYFHDSEVFENGKGRKMNAQDVVYSFNRIRDGAGPGSWVFGSVAVDSGLVALNDSTIKIKLTQPFPPFLGLLGMEYCSVIPKEAVDKYGDDFRRHPVGTGPFKFHFWIENTRLVLLRNEAYFEKDSAGKALPYLDAVSVSFIPDKSAAFLQFLKGNFDFMSGLHASYSDELLNADGTLSDLYTEDVYLQRQPFLKTDYLGFMVGDSAAPDSPLRNADLRKAINYAIDRVSMVRYLRNNVYTPALGGFIPQGMRAYGEDIGYCYRPDSVRALLSRAGYPNGKGLPVIRLSTTSDYVDLCEYVQHQLGEFGIQVKVDVLPASVHRELSARGDLEFFRKSWLADYPDDENFMALFYSGNKTPAGPNYTMYSSAATDNLYLKAVNTTDDATRSAFFAKMDSMVMAEAPIVPLYYDVVMRFVKKEVSGLDRNPMNVIDLRKVKINNQSSQ